MSNPETKEQTHDKRDVVLNPQRIGLAEYRRQDYVVNAEIGTTIQDIMEPSYWAHVASQMQPYDHIEVRMESGEWIAELIVLAVGRNWLKVFLAANHELEAVDPDMERKTATHVIKWRGPQHRHSVVRLLDDAVLQDGFEDKPAAQAWLDNHLRTIER